MTGKAGLKAGLIGGGVAVILAFTQLIPCLGCVTVPLMLLAYGVAGALAAYWLPTPRTAGDGAAAGAVAGAIAGALGGLAWMGVSVLAYSLMGGAEYLVQALPSEVLEMLRQYGIDPARAFSSGMYTATSAACCGVLSLAGIGLGALVGALFGAGRGESDSDMGDEVIDVGLD